MSIIKWFIQKIKQLVQSHKDQKHNDKIEKEYAALIGDPNLTEEQYRQWCLGLTDEDLRQEAEDKAYLEMLAERRDLKDRLDQEDDEKELDRIRCRRCGEAPWSCMCSNPGAENYQDSSKARLAMKIAAGFLLEGYEVQFPYEEYYF